MRKTILVILCVAFATAVQAPTLSGQAPGTDNPELVKAVQQLAEGKYPEAIKALQLLMVGSPSEQVYFHLANAYLLAKDYRQAAAAFADGASKFPLSARLENGGQEAGKE